MSQLGRLSAMDASVVMRNHLRWTHNMAPQSYLLHFFLGTCMWVNEYASGNKSENLSIIKGHTRWSSYSSLCTRCCILTNQGLNFGPML